MSEDINVNLSILNIADHLGLRAIQGQNKAMLQRTMDWARINTGSGHVSGLKTLAPILADAFSDLKAEINLIEPRPVSKINDKGETTEFITGPIIRLTQRPMAPVQVILTGHYDTVYSPDSFDQITDLGGGRMNGPGLADMKGGLCVMLQALKAFESGPDAAGLGYRVVLTPDEETGNFASADHIREAAQGAHIGLTYEPAMETGAMAGARKGSAIFDIILHGKASHAGRAPEAGRSALYAAAAMISEIETLENKIEGVTFNVGRIDGGGPVNIVPELSIIRLGVRAPDDQSAEWATEAVKAALARTCQRNGISGHIHGGFYRPPKPRNGAQNALWDATAQTAKALGLELSFVDTGGVCEGNNVFAAGVPNIDTLGVRGGRIHSTDEFVMVDSFEERAALSLLLLNRLADGRIDAKSIHALMRL
jgi:glutamate carboxypeptidase